MSAFSSSSSSSSSSLGASQKDFFTDRNTPPAGAFSRTSEWVCIRDFLFFVGLPHSLKIKPSADGKNIEFTDLRAVVYRVAIAMNIIQEDYSDRKVSNLLVN